MKARNMQCQYRGCEARATVALGRKEPVQLCDSCAEKDEFKRLKIARPLPEPLTRDLIGKCFSGWSGFVMVQKIIDETTAFGIQVSHDDHGVKIEKTAVYAHQFRNNYLHEITYERFCREVERATQAIPGLTERSDVSGFLN